MLHVVIATEFAISFFKNKFQKFVKTFRTVMDSYFRKIATESVSSDCNFCTGKTIRPPTHK